MSSRLLLVPALGDADWDASWPAKFPDDDLDYALDFNSYAVAHGLAVFDSVGSISTSSGLRLHDMTAVAPLQGGPVTRLRFQISGGRPGTDAHIFLVIRFTNGTTLDLIITLPIRSGADPVLVPDVPDILESEFLFDLSAGGTGLSIGGSPVAIMAVPGSPILTTIFTIDGTRLTIGGQFLTTT